MSNDIYTNFEQAFFKKDGKPITVISYKNKGRLHRYKATGEGSVLYTQDDINNNFVDFCNSFQNCLAKGTIGKLENYEKEKGEEEISKEEFINLFIDDNFQQELFFPDYPMDWQDYI